MSYSGLNSKFGFNLNKAGEMIPNGLVTFLFTDIEGSTKLAQEFPEILDQCLRRHHEIVKETVETNSGFVFKTAGDSFCCAFGNACDAIRAAIETQNKILNEHWNGASIKLRMGIHSGNARWDGENYAAFITLAQTSRIMSAAHGEQILISNDTFKLAESFADNKISFRDLGEIKLKDLILPVRLYQIENDFLRKEFPALNKFEVHVDNLPDLLSNFIGREKEISDILEIISGTRLLTLAGFGGTGKTRLALEVAKRLSDKFTNGIWLIEFAGLSDPGFVVQHTAKGMKLAIDSNKNPIESITDYLREKELLLLLDNCEHLLEACSKFSAHLLRHCPQLKIIATSREALKIEGETVYSVPTLGLPDKTANVTPESLSQFEAVKLFVDRARSFNNNFSITNENVRALLELCCCLDGIPLAIELAAARTKVLTVESILSKVNDRFNLLSNKTRNTLPRQQTLRALIDWSYNLLSEKEKALFQRLSVFAGGWSLEAAENICSDNVIEEFEILDLHGNLIDKSLIIMNEDNGNVRYNMLETIRQYATEKLSDKSETLDKHSNFFLQLAKQWENILVEKSQRAALDSLERDHDNFREAINWCLDNNPVRALEICAEFYKYWELKAYYQEGFATCRKVLDKDPGSNNGISAEVLLNAAYCGVMSGEHEDSEKFLEKSLKLFLLANDRSGEASVFNVLGLKNYFSGKIEDAKIFFEKGLSINLEIQCTPAIPVTLINLGTVFQSKGDYDTAIDHYKKALEYFKRENNKNVHAIARTCANIGSVEYYKTNYQKAIEMYEEAMSIFETLGDHDAEVVTLLNLGNAYFNLTQFDKAEAYYQNCLSLAKDFGYRSLITHASIRIGDIAIVKNETEQARTIYTDCIKICDQADEVHKLANCFKGLGFVFSTMDDEESAVLMFAVSSSLFDKLGFKLQKSKSENMQEQIKILRSRLSEDRFNEIWEEGYSMELKTAIQFALSGDSKMNVGT